ncbi:hypothetical protein [Nonomuraea sp. NPDC050691]|uniref:hypothetical protein n=1 Tax=Nonomuraea sp. NPDC050691 TaxID=3155661 RepID=UPI0033F0304D
MAQTEDAASSPVLAAFAAIVDARVAIHTRDHCQAATLVERAFAPFTVRWYEAYARAAGAEPAVVAGLSGAAERGTAAMPYAEENDWAAACLARTAGSCTAIATRWRRRPNDGRRSTRASSAPARCGWSAPAYDRNTATPTGRERPGSDPAKAGHGTAVSCLGAEHPGLLNRPHQDE